MDRCIQLFKQNIVYKYMYNVKYNIYRVSTVCVVNCGYVGETHNL